MEFLRQLAEQGGPNFSVLFDSYDRGRFLLGVLTTVELSVACILVSLVIGVFGAWVLSRGGGVAAALVQGYVQFFRNTPPLVQLCFFYFAVGGVLPMVGDGRGGQAPLVSGTGWAILAFSLFAGAFNVEIFRSGVEAVPPTTIEAARSLGYEGAALYRQVVLPLALRVCLPALTNNLVNLVKTTTLAYAIGVPELLYAASQIWSEELNVREMMAVLLVTFLVLIALLVWLMERWERALAIPGQER